MPVILHIETSTEVCSVALSDGGKCVFERENREGMNHARMLSPFIAEALAQLSAESKSLSAVAVSCGPGSYTGLRIGVSTAKGLCYGMSVPLIAVPTLQVMAVAVQGVAEQGAWLCPMIDARRMEVYDALFDKDLQTVREVQPQVLDEQSFADVLAERKIYFFGNGSDKFRPLVHAENAHFVENIAPLAKNMIPLAERLFGEGKFEDVAYYEPFYLKDFQPTTPKNKI